MIFLNTLRMIVDLSFYFFFAELFVVTTTNPSQLFHMLILCVCYGISVYLQRQAFRKIYLLLPVLVLFIPGGSLFALFPAILYVIYLLAKENTALSWDRQSELFSASYKIFLIAGACICLSGNYANFIKYSLPMAFICLVTSVLLMRMLRHNPDTYLNPQYQMKNCIFLVIILFFAWLSSREFIFTLIGNGLEFIYMQCIYPLLIVFINCFIFVIRILMQIFSWIKLGEINFQENQLLESEGSPTYADLSTAIGTHTSAFKSVITVLLFIALLVLAFFFFRWLALNRGEESIITHGLDIIRSTDSKGTKKERATSTVLQVRRQYRVFLKLYQEHGGRIDISDTSEDVLKQSEKLFPEAELMQEMRQIYIQARYRNTASKADLKRMKQINKEMANK